MTQTAGSLFSKGTFADLSRRSFDPGGYVDSVINTVSTEQLLSLPEDDITEHLFDRLRLDPITLFSDCKNVDHFEQHGRFTNQIDQVQGAFTSQLLPAIDRFRITIPFRGDCLLWSYRPANYISPLPKGEVSQDDDYKSGDLVLEFSFTDEELHEKVVLARVDRELEKIDFYINSSTADVNRHNTRLRCFLQNSIHQRKHRALRARGIAFQARHSVVEES